MYYTVVVAELDGHTLAEGSRALIHLSRAMMRGMAALRAAGRYYRYSA